MFPIRDNIPSKSFPFVNWIIIAVNLMVFLFELSIPDDLLESFFYIFGLVPARFSHQDWADIYGLRADNYWPFFTNMFLHGGWSHFIGNMWTLFIFGDNVEDRMGHRNYLFFYLLCGLVASLTHYFVYPHSTVPALGASGAISGVMAAYMVLFPRARILMLFPILIIPFFFEISAFIYLAFWFFMQLFNGTFSLLSASEGTGIAFWAHIGGFAAGIFFNQYFGKRKAARERSLFW